jgi:hypothetical protein
MVFFDDIASTWRVGRVVIDRLHLGRVTFEGLATISADDFVEHGRTMFRGHLSQSRRRYRLRTSGDCVVVQFPDGREFIEISRQPMQRVRHQCGDDAYLGQFMFLTPNVWYEAWSVSGPRKSYRSLSKYTRIHSGRIASTLESRSKSADYLAAAAG